MAAILLTYPNEFQNSLSFVPEGPIDGKSLKSTLAQVMAPHQAPLSLGQVTSQCLNQLQVWVTCPQ